MAAHLGPDGPPIICAETGGDVADCLPPGNPVAWNDRGAWLAGNGCQKDIDAFVLANGSDLSLVFSNLGLDLGARTKALWARASCRAQVPISVQPYVVLGQVTQVVSYGVVKTEATSGEFDVRSRLFDRQLQPVGRVFPRGQRLNVPVDQAVVVEPVYAPRGRDDDDRDDDPDDDDDDGDDDWCDDDGIKRLQRGVLRSQFRVFAERENLREHISLFVDGLDLRYDLSTIVFPCPRDEDEDEDHDEDEADADEDGGPGE